MNDWNPVHAFAAESEALLTPIHVPLTAKHPPEILNPNVPVDVAVSPVRDVMSEFAPDCAALKLVRAPAAVVAPVPPYRTVTADVADITPLLAWSGPLRDPSVMLPAVSVPLMLEVTAFEVVALVVDAKSAEAYVVVMFAVPMFEVVALDVVAHSVVK